VTRRSRCTQPSFCEVIVEPCVPAVSVELMPASEKVDSPPRILFGPVIGRVWENGVVIGVEVGIS